MRVNGGMDLLNNTTTALGISGEYTSGVLDISYYKSVVGSAFADQAGTLYIEQSWDGINWDIITSIAVTVSTGKEFDVSVYAPHGRLRYVNGVTAQTIFRLYGAGKIL